MLIVSPLYTSPLYDYYIVLSSFYTSSLHDYYLVLSSPYTPPLHDYYIVLSSLYTPSLPTTSSTAAIFILLVVPLTSLSNHLHRRTVDCIHIKIRYLLYTLMHYVLLREAVQYTVRSEILPIPYLFTSST